MYPSIPSTPSSILLQKSVPPPPSTCTPTQARADTLSAAIMFSLFTGLYSVGGNQVEGRYYATPRRNLIYRAYRTAVKKKSTEHGYHLAVFIERLFARSRILRAGRISSRGAPLLRESLFQERKVDFLISKIEYGEGWVDKLVPLSAIKFVSVLLLYLPN